MTNQEMKQQVEQHLRQDMIPFWKNLRDNTYGGYYGWMDFEHQIDTEAVKGCILNSRILWFFSQAYMTLQDESLLAEAGHAYQFMKQYCIDRQHGGVYWSVSFDGKPIETLKHTYNQAFAIYALSTYYEASADSKALEMAYELYELIETKMRDEKGYLEAFDETFSPIDNDKLSENGVMATRTMNTLLHVFEAYTQLYHADKNPKVKEKLCWMLDLVEQKLYNPKKHRQEVFFDDNWQTLIDLHSYGHDIEASWLIDKCLEVIEEKAYTERIEPITKALTKEVYEQAYVDMSLCNECENGKVDTNRVWWVQAEAVVGFLNGCEHCGTESALGRQYLTAAQNMWEYIKTKMIDTRPGNPAGREWYWLLSKEGKAYEDKPIVEPWKCPYHNGRMCMEVMRRL